MAWWIWMMLGAACILLAIFVYAAIATYLDSVARQRRQSISRQRNAAEQKLQRSVEDTITRMFDATRDHYK